MKTARRMTVRPTRRMLQDYLEAAWFSEGERLRDSELSAGVIDHYRERQHQLEAIARQLSPAAYYRHALIPTVAVQVQVRPLPDPPRARAWDRRANPWLSLRSIGRDP